MRFHRDSEPGFNSLATACEGELSDPRHRSWISKVNDKTKFQNYPKTIDNKAIRI
jgi:hypothetical protein